MLICSFIAVEIKLLCYYIIIYLNNHSLYGIKNVFENSDDINSAFAILVTTVGISTTAFVNAFTQEGFTTEDLVNETIALGNTSDSFKVTDDNSVTLEETTIPEQIVTNATLPTAFAQECAIIPEGMNNTMPTENATE